MYDVHVLKYVVCCVNEEAGGYTVKAVGLVWCTVHFYKVSSTHGQQSRLLH